MGGGLASLPFLGCRYPSLSLCLSQGKTAYPSLFARHVMAMLTSLFLSAAAERVAASARITTQCIGNEQGENLGSCQILYSFYSFTFAIAEGDCSECPKETALHWFGLFAQRSNRLSGRSLELPDGNIIFVVADRFRCVEVLDIRKNLYANVLLSHRETVLQLVSITIQSSNLRLKTTENTSELSNGNIITIGAKRCR